MSRRQGQLIHTKLSSGELACQWHAARLLLARPVLHQFRDRLWVADQVRRPALRSVQDLVRIDAEF